MTVMLTYLISDRRYAILSKVTFYEKYTKVQILMISGNNCFDDIQVLMFNRC